VFHQHHPAVVFLAGDPVSEHAEPWHASRPTTAEQGKQRGVKVATGPSAPVRWAFVL